MTLVLSMTFVLSMMGVTMRHTCTVFVVLFSIITAAKASELGGYRSTEPPKVSLRNSAGQQIQQGYDDAAFARELARLSKFCNGHSMQDQTYSCYCKTPPREYDFGDDEGIVRLCERFYTWDEVLEQARKFRKQTTPQGPRICRPTVVTCESHRGCITIEGQTVAHGTEVGICV
jgi:hypothetical protein